MHISVGNGQFKNIDEIWDVGPNTIEVITASHREVRITARGNVRSGATPSYYASYEERIEIEPKPHQKLRVWCSADFPWQDGPTIEECLRSALGWVDRHGGKD